MNPLDFLLALHWREPWWLLLALQPLLFLWLRARQRRGRLDAWADRRLQPWATAARDRRHRPGPSRQTAWTLAWLLFAIAAAGPRLPLDVPGASQRAGLDILLVLDLSRSMQATDLAPSRLQRARVEIHELLDHVQHDRHRRVGLLVFAGQPHLWVPPTPDLDALGFYLAQLDDLALPIRGSRPLPALARARTELAAGPRPAAIVLLTDGDFPDPDAGARSRLLDLARQLAAEDISLSVLGLGSIEGEAIALPGGGWLKDAEGHPVISRMNGELLADLARVGGGRYREAADDDSDWQALYDGGIAGLGTNLATDTPGNEVIWQEYYPWCLLPGILLVFVALAPLGWPRRGIRHLWMLGLLALLGLPPTPGRAADPLPDAYAAFARGDWLAARERYAAIPGYAGRLGEGACRYRLGDLDGAARQFSAAALEAEDDSQRATALFNLGNSLFRLGDYAGATEAYTEALRYRPDHPASLRNRRLSRRLQEQVEAQRAAPARRAGRGPRRGRTEGSVEVDASASLTLGEQRESENKGARGSGLPPETFATLVQKRLDRARLAATGKPETTDSAWRQSTAAARLRMQELTDDRAQLFQRLFEMEAGFPGPLDEPVSRPGVAPW